VTCYYCDADAVQECPRCGALYCDEHGGALCERCQDPASALPSYRVFRGSLVALLVGTLFALWLLIRPPDSLDADGPLPGALAGAVPTVTATALIEGQPTPLADGETPPPTEGTPGGEGTPEGTPAATDTPTATETPEPTPEPPQEIQHTVTTGETLISIAALYLPPGTDAAAFVDQIAAANGITDPTSLAVGQVLTIPQ
jgi:LysM repeat protein